MEFRYDDEKNDWLYRERGVTFEDVVAAIAEYGLLADYEHPDQQKYPRQRLMVVNIGNYPHCVPYTFEGEALHLKTVYPSRKFRFLIEGDKNE